MVERRLLTEQFVTKVRPPQIGERWIADTKQRGFGLRLWPSVNGDGKAFALRVLDANGARVRMTFDHARHRALHVWLYPEEDFELGAVLAQARAWARDEIDLLKHKQTVQIEEHLQREHFARRLSQLTFAEAAQNLLRWMRVNRRSEGYVDRIDKLFFRLVPEQVSRQSFAKLSPEKIADAIVKPTNSAGNMRIAKAFVGQIYEQANRFWAVPHDHAERFTQHFWLLWTKRIDVAFPELRSLGPQDYERLFRRLEGEQAAWRQALAIRLYFKFGAPLSRVLSGRWEQVLDDFWYPYWPHQKRYWFESRERIDDEARALLKRVRERSGLNKKSGFWFPSGASRKGSITTVDAFWRQVTRELGVGSYPLREFARSFRDLNNPSYLISFIRQYERTFRDLQNAAEVSKRLAMQRRVGINSVG
jgi:integrase